MKRKKADGLGFISKSELMKKEKKSRLQQLKDAAKKFPIWGIVLIAVGGVVLITLFVCAVRLVRKGKTDVSEAEKNLQNEIRMAEELGMELDKYDDGKKVRVKDG